MILPIVTEPNEILRKKSLEIRPEQMKNPEFLTLVKDMIDTMGEKQGIGIAAPQIGKNIRLIVISTQNGPLALVNPKIIKTSVLKATEEEGCLSVPKMFGMVKRFKKITVSALSYKGEALEFEAKGLFARVIQHEMDHLDGILFIDKAEKIKEIAK